MAVRHEVENLIRRGNIFYWRPRIPAAFVHCRPGSRLSLSLHCSDHRKAQIIGRKLNTRLAELKMNSKDAMTTKQQLQILFEHERDKELERAGSCHSAVGQTWVRIIGTRGQGF
ncbi:hypothetical protein EV128_101202 [Rhizobium azibense]|nr:hypothetical protein EV128_101202 [Rhizobium azibense]